MTPFAIGILAVSMSVDAFLACVGKGAGGHRPDFGRVLRTGAIFGAIEAATPVIGWAAGMAASQYVAAVDHWIAFGLLFAVGARMMFHALASGDDAPCRSVTLWTTIATAVGTSVDAMAVGVSLAFLDVNIWLVALACGLTTMLMSTAGLMAGRFLGQHFRVWAEVAGGLALCGLGLSILITHLSGG